MRNIEQLNFKFGEGAAYSTLYNPNYIGSFVVLVIPILAYYSNKMKTNLWNFIVVLSIVLSVVLIFAAKSSAGILALGFIIIAFIFVSLFGKSFKRYKLKILIGILIFTSIFGLTFKNSIITLAKDIFEPFKTLEELETNKFIDKLENNGKYFTFSFSNGKELNIQLNDKNTPMYYDKDWNDLSFDYDKEKNILTFHNKEYNFVRIKYFNDNVIGIAKRSSEHYLSQSRGYVYVKMRYLNSHPVNHYNEKIKNYDDIPRLELLDGYERVGSGRGYIWSRSIPLTYDSWFIGSGPDSFILEFPQNDIYGKTNYMKVPQIIVDKPHNMFLGMAINTGVISLLLFLAGVLSILWKAVKYKGEKQFLIFSTISILAFLITGLFNDSIVAIMPIFYLILGSMLSITSSNKFD
jgi:hypothetical protein